VGRIFITGSSAGLGLMAGHLLVEQGHSVVLHARNDARARGARESLPAIEAIIAGDVSTIAGAKRVAEEANTFGRFDAIIHNVGIGYREPYRIETEDGLPHVFAVNVMAPYVLTALIEPPARLVYLSSALHHAASARFDDLLWQTRPWDGTAAYSETKLYDAMFAFAVARHWPGVVSNALEPGWVQTRMGGPSATDDLDQAHLTQAWLAVGDGAAMQTGGYFYHMERRSPNPQARDLALQERLLSRCSELTGISLPLEIGS
jgi:NAD(P)-dependent dehydrogenase (short-subunit alcohol dehydrogenase family)